MSDSDDGSEEGVMEKLIAAKLLPKPQGLRQRASCDCSVPVFAALAGVSEDEVRHDVPKASLGEVSVDEWVCWLEGKGFKVSKIKGCPGDAVPCAHLVAVQSQGGPFHWVYRDGDGDVLDPSPTFRYMPASDPRMRNLSIYGQKVLTLSIVERFSRL